MSGIRNRRIAVSVHADWWISNGSRPEEDALETNLHLLRAQEESLNEGFGVPDGA